MNIEKKINKIIIISSPSGAGKTTICNYLVKKLNNIDLSISYTTRNKRANEVNSKDYYFVNNEKFKKLIKNKKFLEYAKVFKNYYGSLRENVIAKLTNGEDIIFDIDWQGTKQIKNKKLNYKIITIFILPPSKKELYERLLKREKKDKKIASERMKQFKDDVMHWIDYDYTVINDKVEGCYKQIISFIRNKKLEKRNFKYDKRFIKDHIQKLVS